MRYEKKKLLFRKIRWIVLLLLGIIIPIIIANRSSAEIIDDSGYISNYYEYLNTTTCEIEVTFNVPVDSADVTVAFYDDQNQLLAQETGHFFGNGSATLSHTFYSIDGKVDSYEILYYSANIYNTAILYYLFFVVDISIFVFFIAAMLLSCKIYDYNGVEILVYAGWYHHYIKVDDVKVDEHNTIVSHVPICLSTTLQDGTNIYATISLTNRIALKINDRLYIREK